MPKISRYEFGKIVVDGVPYAEDVMILSDRVVRWWRKEGHRLRVEDLSDVLEDRPQDIVIGTGYDGMMDVPKEVQDDLRSRGMSIHVGRTSEAVAVYEELLSKNRRVAAALHLTC